MKIIEVVTKAASNRLLAVAEWALWVFVGVGLCQLCIEGVVNLESFLLASCVASILIAALFQIISISCKMIANYINNR